eukprot:jgi/Bigna1/76004/fgenesh1_pg.38_\
MLSALQLPTDLIAPPRDCMYPFEQQRPARWWRRKLALVLLFLEAIVWLSFSDILSSSSSSFGRKVLPRAGLPPNLGAPAAVAATAPSKSRASSVSASNNAARRSAREAPGKKTANDDDDLADSYQHRSEGGSNGLKAKVLGDEEAGGGNSEASSEDIWKTLLSASKKEEEEEKAKAKEEEEAAAARDARGHRQDGETSSRYLVGQSEDVEDEEMDKELVSHQRSNGSPQSSSRHQFDDERLAMKMMGGGANDNILLTEQTRNAMGKGSKFTSVGTFKVASQFTTAAAPASSSLKEVRLLSSQGRASAVDNGTPYLPTTQQQVGQEQGYIVASLMGKSGSVSPPKEAIATTTAATPVEAAIAATPVDNKPAAAAAAAAIVTGAESAMVPEALLPKMMIASSGYENVSIHRAPPALALSPQQQQQHYSATKPGQNVADKGRGGGGYGATATSFLHRFGHAPESFRRQTHPLPQQKQQYQHPFQEAAAAAAAAILDQGVDGGGVLKNGGVLTLGFEGIGSWMEMGFDVAKMMTPQQPRGGGRGGGAENDGRLAVEYVYRGVGSAAERLGVCEGWILLKVETIDMTKGFMRDQKAFRNLVSSMLAVKDSLSFTFEVAEEINSEEAGRADDETTGMEPYGTQLLTQATERLFGFSSQEGGSLLGEKQDSQIKKRFRQSSSSSLGPSDKRFDTGLSLAPERYLLTTWAGGCGGGFNREGYAGEDGDDDDDPLLGGKEGKDGFGELARFHTPRAMILDSEGTVYTACSEEHSIRAISPGGQVWTVAGGLGRMGLMDGSSTTARFRYPHGVAIDPEGNLYIADTVLT